MASYASYPVLGRVKLPNNTVYALIDVDGREMIAPTFSSSSSYVAGDYVIYTDHTSEPAVDTLYRFNSAHSGAWTGTDATPVTVGSEIKRALDTIAGGIHYRGKTTSKLYEGSTLNPIIINGNSTPVEAGDMVTEDLPSSASTYATNTAYAKGDYVKYNNLIYQVNEAITAGENTSWSAVESKMITTAAKLYTTGVAYSKGDYVQYGNVYYQVNDDITALQNTGWEDVADKMGIVKGSPMFIWAEGQWTMLSGVGDGLGDLAYKDSASGTYTKPTGSGSVTIKNVSVDKGALATTTITGTDGTESVSRMTPGTAVAVATVDTAVRYGTANVGTAVTYGTADVGAATTYGTANKAATPTTVATAGDTFNYGTADVGSSVSVAQVGASFVYGTADVGDEVTYGTANCDTPVTGIAKVGSSKTFSQNAIKFASTAVEGDCLVFDNAGSDSVIGIADTTGVSITPAVASTSKLTPAKAAATTQTANKVTSTSITPAVSAGTAHSARGVAGTTDIYQAVDSQLTLTPATASNKTLTPAVEAGSSQTLIPAKANGTITPYTVESVTVAKAAASATTVATGSLTTGTQLVTGVTQGTESATVSVGTTNDTVTVS